MPTFDDIKDFFARSDWLDRYALRPLEHIAPSWDLRWDGDRYLPEPYSFAEDLNEVIEQIASCDPPASYHDNEDILATETLISLKWPIQKKGSRWIGEDYACILEQGSFNDVGQGNLIKAAAGRVHKAFEFGQRHFDEMEHGHLVMLAALISIILYQRENNGNSYLVEEDDADLAPSPAC